jgi:hypothetical protein
MIMAWQWKDLGAPHGQTLELTFIAPASGQGRPYVFVWGHNGHLWVNWFDGHAWQWKDLGVPHGQTFSPLYIATASYNSNPMAFVWGSNGHLWVNWSDGTAWHWKDQGVPHGQTLNPLYIATASYNSNPMAFVFGGDRHLWVNWFDGHTWHWKDQGVPHGQTLNPLYIATASYNSNPMAFVFGGDRHLWVNWFDGHTWHWKDQGTPQGQTVGLGSDDYLPAIATASCQGRPYVFTFGSDGHLWANWWDGQAWQWTDHGSPPGPDFLRVDEIATASRQDRPMVFTKTQDKQQTEAHLWANWWDGSAWHWTEQDTPPGTDFPLETLAAVSCQSRPYVFVWDNDTGSDSDPHIWVNWWSPERFDGLAVAAAQGNEDLVLTATGVDGSGPDAVWAGKVLGGNGSFTGWSKVGQPGGGALACRPAAARDGSSLVEIVVSGKDGAVWLAREDPDPGTGWSAWQSLGQPGGEPVVTAQVGDRPPDPAPSLIGNADGRLEIFVVRNDFTVWHIWQTQAGGVWSGWEPLGLPGGQDGDGTAGPLVTAINADGRLELFATTNANDTVQHCWQQQPGGSWSGWESLDSPAGRLAGSRLAVARNNNGCLELLMVSPDGVIWHRAQAQAGASWSGWTPLDRPKQGDEPGRDLDDVTVAQLSDGDLIVFATEPVPAPASPGSPPWLWARTEDSQGAWSDWQEVAIGPPGSTTTLPVEGPVLTMRDGLTCLLLRETGTANIYLLTQRDFHPRLGISWSWQYLEFH